MTNYPQSSMEGLLYLDGDRMWFFHNREDYDAALATGDFSQAINPVESIRNFQAQGTVAQGTRCRFTLVCNVEEPKEEETIE
jgi:hypothetical protein